jgi:hypothetical protein
MKKDAVSAKKGLRVPGTNLRTPFNGNAEMHTGAPNGPNKSGNADRWERDARLKQR